MKIKKVVDFFKQTVFEAKKISWCKGRDVFVSSVVVGVVACVSGLFFVMTDSLIVRLVQAIINVW